MLVEERPLLLTKLEVPPPRAHTLARERLVALARERSGTRLLLLSAPAGFGKTTLLSCWCRALITHGATVAWLTLDEDDDEPARFLAYLRAAIARALELPAGQHDPVAKEQLGRSDIADALTRLINALAEFDHDMVLVLDDYHIITTPAIHTAVTFLLDHLPARVCLAIGSRADPPLPLARLRAREQLVELRAADLRFTPEDVQTFVQLADNVVLSPEQARAICSYAEGWPAGVQLIALALRADEREAAPRLDRWPAHLGDSQSHVFAYLADDVFERQPAHLKSFLLQTAILDRMCAPLCDAVMGVGGWELGVGGTSPTPNPQLPTPGAAYSRLILEELERANLFLIPLDGERGWYRYHHLFRAFLCARLAVEPRHAVAELHRRASVWFERSDILPSAVEHALAAGEIDRAAELIEGLAPEMIERGEYATLNSWLDQLPDPRHAAARWPRATGRSTALVESLSERELEVLRLIAGGASNQAIGAALVISLGTVKSHINHILGKLGARNRTEAVARARDLDLLPNDLHAAALTPRDTRFG
jgi:LuxR family maltose regulon positive regulatory protein